MEDKELWLLIALFGGNIVINGGTFSVDPTDYAASGKTVTANSNGTWTVA